jgi:CspA family cold shock protein
MPNEIHSGTLNAYDPIKGVGFIRRDKGKDVFVHFSDFAGEDRDAKATLGSMVQFELEHPVNPKGPRARNVTIIG